MEDLSKMSKEQIIEKARAAKKAEEWEKVEKLQLELLRRNPNDVDAISSLVVVAKKLKNWEYLIKLQEMRLNIDPQNIPSMADLANVAAKQNNWQEAEKMERRILEINPQDKKAKRQLKYILKKQREIDCVGIYRKELKTENMNITKANEAIANLKQKGGIRENLLIAEIQASITNAKFSTKNIARR